MEIKLRRDCGHTVSAAYNITMIFYLCTQMIIINGIVYMVLLLTKYFKISQVNKTRKCGHRIKVACWIDPDERELCTEQCTKTLDCTKLCFEECKPYVKIKIEHFQVLLILM
jgi:hypothetical protein